MGPSLRIFVLQRAFEKIAGAILMVCGGLDRLTECNAGQQKGNGSPEAGTITGGVK
jgi:hypothetical protein